MFSLYMFIVILVVSHFGFKSGTVVLIVLVPGHCLPFYLYSLMRCDFLFIILISLNYIL